MIIEGSTTINTDDLDQYRFIDESSMIIDDFPQIFKLKCRVYRSPLANCHSQTTLRRKLVHGQQTMVHGERSFTPFKIRFFGELQVAMGELPLRRTLVRGGWDFFLRTNFLEYRSPFRGGLRSNPGEPGRTPPYSGERSAYSGERLAKCRCRRTAGEFARNSPEFAQGSPEFVANDSSPGT